MKKLFSPIQEKIYLTILENPKVQISELSRIIKLHRPRLYKEIKVLENNKSVLKTTIGKSKHYSAANPENLISEVEENYRLEISNLSNLKSLYNANNKDLQIELFQGKESIRKAYEIIVGSIPKNGNIYRFESLQSTQRSKQYMPEIYFKRCGENGDVKRYVITNSKTSNRRQPKMTRYSKVLQQKDINFEQNMAQVITGKHVLFFDYKTESVVLFTGSIFADFQRSIFISMYNMIK